MLCASNFLFWGDLSYCTRIDVKRERRSLKIDLPRVVEMQLLTGFEVNCSAVRVAVRVAAALRRVYVCVNNV